MRTEERSLLVALVLLVSVLLFSMILVSGVAQCSTNIQVTVANATCTNPTSGPTLNQQTFTIVANIVGLFLVGATGAAAVAYSLLDTVIFPGITSDPVWKDSQDSVTTLMKKLEGDEKAKPPTDGYYKMWENALKDLKTIEGRYVDYDPYPPDDRISMKEEEIKKATEVKDTQETERLKKGLSDIKTDLAKNLIDFHTKIERPAEALMPIQEEFEMKLKELGEIQWEIDKLQTALRQNWVDVAEHKAEIRRWAVPLYVLVGGALATIGVYAQGGGSAQALDLSLNSVYISFGIGGAWTAVAKYFKTKSEAKVTLTPLSSNEGTNENK